MKIFMILLCLGFFTVSVFLIAKFGIKKKEGSEYVSSIHDNLDNN